MQSTLHLYATAIVALMGVAATEDLSLPSRKNCPSVFFGQLLESDIVCVFSVWDETKMQIICLSSHPIKWVFGSNSSKVSSDIIASYLIPCTGWRKHLLPGSVFESMGSLVKRFFATLCSNFSYNFIEESLEI